MIFDTFALDNALGTILAHTIRLNPKTVIKKGTVLEKSHLASLKQAGKSTIMAAKLEANDVSEDHAAQQIAHALGGDHVTLSRASTGRCNLIAEARGVVHIEGALITGLNLVSESITIATLAPYALVTPKQMIATIKIIPFAVTQAALEAVLELITASHALRISPIQSNATIGMVLTNTVGGRESLLDKAQQALQIRLENLGCQLNHHLRCAHDTASITDSINQLNAKGCNPIFICGATATVDRFDVAPAAIIAAGGGIERYGIPVDPGNLLVLGSIDTTKVIVMPGCARSLKLNGFDWVLERVLADVPISNLDFATLGVGGLLEEMPSRPLSRSSAVAFDPSPTLAQGSAAIAAIILAAGQSTRMGKDNKLLTSVGGRTMLAQAVAAATQSKATHVTIVTGHQADEIKQALPEFSGKFVHNPNFKDGLSTSVQCGIASLNDEFDGALIILGDMPGINAEHVNALIEAFDPELDHAICVATHHGKRGNPVLWSRYFFAEMMQLTGDRGARHLLRQHGDVIIEVEMTDDAVLIDIDTKDELLSHQEISQ